MLTRRRFKQTRTLDQRLADEAARLRDKARGLPPGREREMLLRRARQDETAMQIDAWLRSPGLRAPT
ncbi:hypothetical protein A5906_33975 [Bradyrhizobium sacchari]|uniref:Uncharacterized protein n=1 Tax=Bradyrhizobium sacchari TaxID=1399419 RepID=A0A560JN17_9BRAD|nr:hypothetical protein [Bradyrhizobium sacchari]OPY97969.1 hypothetical protein A5906_33975 [Bradyrhizobium sacchari]TWB59078.1 hypothetical protein FBZ94_105354 [Bradyrhizobium sacchari]TWB72562.1 hypothetical protein FBZ95_106277 [Bradyrhizobium sacchari]